MIEAIIVHGLEKIKDVNVVREEIDFKHNENVKIFQRDSYDEQALHVILYEDQVPTATGRLLCSNEYVIDKVYVKLNKRNKYYGDLVVKMLIDKAFNMGASEVFALVPVNGIGFFNSIGFSQLEESDLMQKMFITKDRIIKCKH